MWGIGEHIRRFAHALEIAIGLHGAKKVHPIVKYKHYQISSGARGVSIRLVLVLPHRCRQLTICINNTLMLA